MTVAKTRGSRGKLVYTLFCCLILCDECAGQLAHPVTADVLFFVFELLCERVRDASHTSANFCS